jgi:Domain of unknown function (DUF4365)
MAETSHPTQAVIAMRIRYFAASRRAARTRLSGVWPTSLARVVDEMGHLWDPTVGVDSGIDREIELRDQATRGVRNVHIGVQSKTTDGKWDRETARSFSYRPRPKDVAFWLSSNQRTRRSMWSPRWLSDVAAT